MSRTLTNITLGLLTIPVIMLQGGTTVAQQAQMSGSASHEHLVATCAEVPPGQKRPEFGCFIIATKKGLHFTQPTVYWHLRVFPSRVEAEAVKSPTGIVVEEDRRVWLSEFGAQDSAPRGGEGVAVIGPLELPPAKTYDAVLSYAVMRPGDRSLVHTHPGSEGWYMLAGEQCLETPSGTKRAGVGETITVSPNVPMELSIVGTTIRRSLVLIIHDSAQAAILPSDWKPSGACNSQSSAPAQPLILQESDGKQRPDVPDTIFVNGRVFTAANAHPYAEAIAVKGSRILAVDTNQQISALARPNTRRIDLGRRLVIPGLNDVHTHFGADFEATVMDFGGLDPVCARVLDKVQQTASSAPRGALLFGMIGPAAFFDPACTPAALDKIAPGDPVVLSTWTPHAGMLNQLATQKFGINLNDPPPLAGWFGKDMKSKTWDGVVHQSAWFRIFQALMTDRSREQSKLQSYLDNEARWGVTSITIMEVEPERRVEMLAAMRPPIRVRLVPFLPFQDQNQRRKPAYPTVPQKLADRVTVNGVKWLLDGDPVERSSAMREPYSDDPTTSGQVDFPPAELRDILQEAQQRNVQPLLHTVGDRTTEILLDQMDATGGAAEWSPRRLRIEHGDGIKPDLIPRAKKLGVIVVENPTHFALGDLWQRRLGAERARVFQPMRSLLDAGIPLAIASDGGPGAPVLNPYLNLMLAAYYPGKPNESLSREQAVIAYTRTAAYAEFAEKDKGTLEAGKFADFAVLSQDIFEVSPPELPKTESLLTVVGGAIVYNAGIVSAK